MILWGASLIAVDCIGRTPMHFIVQTDDNSVLLIWLLQERSIFHNYNLRELINAQTGAGVTPLMLAAKVNNYKNVEILLNSGANPFLKDQLGQ